MQVTACDSLYFCLHYLSGDAEHIDYIIILIFNGQLEGCQWNPYKI